MATEVRTGDEVQFWRRDPGGKSELISAVCIEDITWNNVTTWCVIKRHDTGEERSIDVRRLNVVKLGPLRDDE